MNLFVIDANVATKWSLSRAGEALVEQSLGLLNRYGRGEVQFVVPDLFWAELGNLFWKAVRLGQCARATAESGLAEMRERSLPTVPSETLVEPALVIATTFDRTEYDGSYVALAIESRGQLVMADETLANTVAAHLPVKWLGTIL